MVVQGDQASEVITPHLGLGPSRAFIVFARKIFCGLTLVASGRPESQVALKSSGLFVMTDYVVAVRTDDARDFLLQPSGVVVAPSESPEFTIGSRVRITDVAKCFLKFDVMAEKLALGKWTSGMKPIVGSVATVLASSKHPTDDATMVVGIRSEFDGRDFIIDSKGLAKAPNVSSDFPANASVRIKSADKVYTKMDGAAKDLSLSKWITGAKPQTGEVGNVIGSTVHPADENLHVIGIRTVKGQDFVIAPEGLESAPNESENFPVGCRVYISNIDKLYTKMDEVARSMNLSRWAAGAKPTIPVSPSTDKEATGDDPAPKKRKLGRPLMSCAAEVKGSIQHPSGSGCVIGVRTETGQEFLVAEEGLQRIPDQHPDFSYSTRVKITDPGKVYPKLDEKAFELALTRWMVGEKLGKSNVTTGKIMGSTAK